uniref:EF-hand domain-containing protein n=1 Tax=Zooxanthella nutricula TaxID=1333877 RepID=A0A7S2KMA7_9DINO
MDLAWTEKPAFESLMSAVILANSVTMGLELDINWDGFFWINVFYLVFYIFEVVAKIKRQGRSFFTTTWNNLDFLLSFGCLADLLAIPAFNALVSAISGDASPHWSASSGVLSVLPVFRVLRVLRLYKLLTSFPALKKLVLGIAAAMHGTFWVIVLAFLVLYIFAILFTSLIGRGVVVNREDHHDAVQAFGSVAMSLYNMFKLMNDDQSVVMFTDSVWVRVMFMVAMVMLNWVMLATLTSVVTDNMNSHSVIVERQEMDRLRAENDKLRERRLTAIFREMDKDANGQVDCKEFHDTLGDTGLRSELQDAADLSTRDLVELFDYISQERQGGRVCLYEDFISKLKRESEPVRERTIFRVEEELRALERRINQQFSNLAKIMQQPIHERTLPATPQPELQLPRWEKKARDLAEQDEAETRRREIMLSELVEQALPGTPRAAKAKSPQSPLMGDAGL